MTSRLLALTATCLLMVGCGSNSGSGPIDYGPTGQPGIALPAEVSALPPSDASGGVSGTSLRGALAVLRQAVTADSDYAKAQTIKYVDERALSQFSVLNTILSAMDQTHYAYAENVGVGPYGNIVSWTEDGDSAGKQMVPWVVSSRIAADGKNVVDAWIYQQMGKEGEPTLLKARVTIAEAPTANDDGSYSDYGVWSLDVDFGAPGFFFAADVSRGAAGEAVIAIHQVEPGGGVTRGVLHKSGTTGYGKVSFPDWNDCHSDQCSPPLVTVSYAYDADSVVLQRNDGAPVYKSRVDFVNVGHQYGLFDAVTGQDVSKAHTFGFPITYGQGTSRRWGNYSSWQGRHQIWMNGQSLPAGSTVKKNDFDGSSGETYTVSPVFTGLLVKRTLIAAALDDIRDVVVNTQINLSTNIVYTSANGWRSCANTMWDAGSMTCPAGWGTFDLANLVANTALNENVNINGWDQSAMQQLTLLYAGGKFYHATQSFPQTSTGVEWLPNENANLWVNINKPAFVYWNGSAWMKKNLVAFNQNTWTPTFGEGEEAFSLELNREYYLNSNGSNYVVKNTGSGYDVRIERQSVANPTNAATFAPAGMVFTRMWGDTSVSFVFDTSPSSPNFLKLVRQDNTSVALTTPEWGLQARVGGVLQADQYNWEYPNPGDSCTNCGVQQFLVDAAGQYVVLDNPIRLAAVQLANHAGQTKTYALQFDGNWVNGLPDIWNDLQAANYHMNAEIAAKVVFIEAGTIVTDAENPNQSYLFKPLRVQQYLKPLADPSSSTLDVATAAALDLDSAMPTYENPGMGPLPDVPLKYVEGVQVQ